MIPEEFNRHIKNKDFRQIFTYIYDHCFAGSAGQILSRGGIIQDAEDVFQEAILVLHDKIVHKEFELTANICAFLSKTSRFIWLKKLRNQQDKTIQSEKIVQLPIEENLAKISERETAFSLMENGIQQLTGLCREVLYAYYYEGKSTKEIAENSGKPVNTIKQRLHGCRKMLRTYIEKMNAQHV